jgi:hypothetical protein
VKLFLLGLDKQEIGIILFAFLFLLLALGTIYWINRSFRTIDIGDTITVKGYFWGQCELNLKEIHAYKLLKIRRTKHAIQDFNLVLYDRDQNKKLEVTQGNYKTKDWDNFIKKLTVLNIQFIGQESLVNQWRYQWTTFKNRFVK